MAEITWQNVNAPSNADVFRGMLLASQGVNSATESFKDAGTKLASLNTDAMKQQDEAKSYAIKSLLAGTKNVGEVDALMPKIQELTGSMYDKGAAGTLVSSIMPDAQKQFGAREQAGTSAFGAEKGAIEQPLKIADLEGRTNIDFLNLPKTLGTYSTTQQTAADTAGYKAGVESTLAPLLNQAWADTETSKAKLAKVEAAAKLGITPEMSGLVRDTVKLGVPQAEQKLAIARDAASPEKTAAMIAGGDLSATAAAEKTKAEIMKSRDDALQAAEGAGDRADIKVKAASDIVGTYDTALAAHKASYASADAVTKFLTDNKVEPTDAQNLVTNYSKAALNLKKEYPEYDIDHMPLNALKTIIGASNLSPATWFNETGPDAIKAQLKNYFESGSGRKDTEANLETEKRIATERYRASQDYEMLRAKRKPESVSLEQAAVKNLEAKAEQELLKKEIADSTAGGFEGEPLKPVSPGTPTSVSTSLFPPTKHTFDFRRLLGSEEEIKARDAKVKARKEAQNQLLK